MENHKIETRASSCTETSFCCATADDSRPTMVLQTENEKKNIKNGWADMINYGFETKNEKRFKNGFADSKRN
jgi:hypothetical protein